jgi:signal peptidase I
VIVYALIALAFALGTAVWGVHRLRRRVAVVTVSGPSMQPTLHSGDRLLVRRARGGQVRTGQVVVISRPASGTVLAGGTAPPGGPPSWPPGQGDWMIKRVAAVPGDPTPAVMMTSARDAQPLVPPGKLVVLGDNHARSLDSRQIGYLPAEHVLGIMVRPLPARGRHRASWSGQPGGDPAQGRGHAARRLAPDLVAGARHDRQPCVTEHGGRGL